jgi:Flp pilus assembly protein TadG
MPHGPACVPRPFGGRPDMFGTDDRKTAKPGSVTRRFAKDEQGIAAVWFALMLVPILGFIFGAIKFTQLTEQRSGMIDAMDAAGLAFARYASLNNLGNECNLVQGDSDADKENREKAKRFAREYFSKNYPENKFLFANKNLTKAFDPETDLTFNLNCSIVTVQANAYTDMGGVLNKYFGVGAIPLNLNSKIALPSAGKVELALVLDVSGSMQGCAEMNTENNTCAQTKIEGLKDAVGFMMDTLYGKSATATNEFVRTAIVPFNSIVNASPYSKDANLSWFDLHGKAPYHGMNFLHAEWSNDETKPDWERLTTGGRKVNHMDLFRSVGSKGMVWKGCTEARPFPLDELVGPPGKGLTQTDYDAAREMPSGFEADSRLSSDAKGRIDAAWKKMDIPNPGSSSGYLTSIADPNASLFVPWFYPDEPDCDDMLRSDRCRTSHPDQTSSDNARYADAEQYTAGDAKWWPLLDHPNKHYDEYDYRNKSFIRDDKYVDYFKAPDRKDPWRYKNFVLEYRNSMDPESSDCAPNFKSFKEGATYEAEGALVDFANAVGATDCGDHEYKMRMGYVGFFDDRGTISTDDDRYLGKYETYDHKELDSWMKTGGDAGQGGPNLRCGPGLLPLTDQKKTIMDLIESLKPAGGTNSAEGIAWGWRMLSHEAPYDDAVKPGTIAAKNWRKIAILMTDGQNNINKTDTHTLSSMNAYGYLMQDRLGVTKSNWSHDEKVGKYTVEMDNKTIRVCNRMQAEGIKVYTIGYDIDITTNEGRAIRDMLKACANHPEGASNDEKTYFAAENSTELESVFEEITKTIVELHITG